MKKGFKYTGQWSCGNSAASKSLGLPRGDEETRAFVLRDGRDGQVRIDKLSGGYYAYLYVSGELVRRYPETWGVSTKRKAMSNAAMILRQYAAA